MFIIIGVVILVASFAFALFTLILEERKGDKAEAERQKEEDQKTLDQDKLDSDNEEEEKGRERDLQRRNLEEKVALAKSQGSQEEQGAVSGTQDAGLPADSGQDEAGDSQDDTGQERDPFFWEQEAGGGQSQSLEEPASDSRQDNSNSLPHDRVPDDDKVLKSDNTLSGTININDIREKRED